MMKDTLKQLGLVVIPTKGRHKLKRLFIRSGKGRIPYEKVGLLFLATLFVSIAWYIYIALNLNLFTMPLGYLVLLSVLAFSLIELVMLLLAFIVFRIILEVIVYNRTQVIEQKLPLFLTEFSTNLKAGREFVDALQGALSEEFGPLYEDLRELVTEIKSGKMIEDVVGEYSRRYDSYAINESFEIILDAYKGGGGLSEIIDKIAENLDMIHYLKKNAIANVSNYIIFMTIVSIVIAPILFALSHNLLRLIEQLLRRVALAGGSSYMTNFIRPLEIDFGAFRLFSQLGVGLISASAAAIIGVIRKGSLKGASFLILLYAGIALLFYHLSLWLLGLLFNSLYGIT